MQVILLVLYNRIKELGKESAQVRKEEIHLIKIVCNYNYFKLELFIL
jgi:hypothetical protein